MQLSANIIETHLGQLINGECGPSLCACGSPQLLRNVTDCWMPPRQMKLCIIYTLSRWNRISEWYVYDTDNVIILYDVSYGWGQPDVSLWTGCIRYWLQKKNFRAGDSARPRRATSHFHCTAPYSDVFFWIHVWRNSLYGIRRCLLLPILRTPFERATFTTLRSLATLRTIRSNQAVATAAKTVS